MAEESAPVRESLATSLARLGWQPRTPAEKARFAVARRNISACIALGEAGRNELIETSTSSPKPSVRAEAALALAQVGGESAITAIVAALTDRKLHVRHAAALALQRLGWVPPSSELEDSLQAALHQTPPKAVAYVPDNPSVREVHLYVEGGASQALVDEIIRALHPEFLAMPRLKIFEHPVTDWPEEPFVLAAVDLRMHHRIRLTTDNCLTQNGSAYGKRLYLVMLT